MTQFRTTAAYISGGICGPIWWPVGQVCGKLVKADARGLRGFYDDGDSFRDALLSYLTREGGDFQSATFTADTVLRIERRRVDGPGKYAVHVREIELAKLPDCADLVDPDHYCGDFLGED